MRDRKDRILNEKKSGAVQRAVRRILITAVLLIALLFAGSFIIFRNFGIMPAKFVTVHSEEELVEEMMDGFSTGYESVSVRTDGFRLDESRIASYISAEISNDAEDMCIFPERYTASGMDLFGLWQFRLFFAEGDTLTGLSEESEEEEASGGAQGQPSSGGEISGEGYIIGEQEEAGKEIMQAQQEEAEDGRRHMLQAQSQVSETLDRVSMQIAEETAASGGGETELHHAIFVYLCNNVEYDYELSEAILSGDYSSPLRKNRGSYGALVEGRTVCSGYAAAYKAICDRLGLECWVASSLDHAWNLIRVDGKVYCVDATSGDQATWIAEQFFMVDPASYESEYGYRPDESCYIPEQFLA